jgi:hypothetical protein
MPAEAFVDFLAGGQGRIQPRVERRSPGRRPLGDLLARSAFVRGINHDSLYLIELPDLGSVVDGSQQPNDMPPPSLGKYSRSLQKRTSSPAPGLPWGNATTPHLRLDGSRRDRDRWIGQTASSRQNASTARGLRLGPDEQTALRTRRRYPGRSRGCRRPSPAHGPGSRKPPSPADRRPRSGSG